MADINFTPPKGVQKAAARGLELRRKHKKGGTAVGVARARDLSNGKNMSPSTIKRMVSFFARHAGNEEGPEDDAGRIAWLLWGGDPGKRWANKIAKQLSRKDGLPIGDRPVSSQVMKTAYRQDRLQAELTKPVMTPSGAMLVEGYAARPGIYTYVNADGSLRRELVPEDALWSVDSISTLGRAPVTLEHPSELVNSDNVSEYGVGDVDSEIVQAQNGFVRVRFAVRRQDAIDALRSGKVELSPGYRVLLDETPGEHPEFGRYDAIQMGREYNHLAIVDMARGGSEMCTRIDAADAAIMENPISFEEPTMGKKTITPEDAVVKVDEAPEEEEEEVVEDASEEEEEEVVEDASEEEEVVEDAYEEEEEEEVVEDASEEDEDEDKPAFLKKDAAEFHRVAHELFVKIDALTHDIAKLLDDAAKPEEVERNDSDDNDRLTWYNLRRSIEARADATGVSYTFETTNVEIARATLDAAGIENAHLGKDSVLALCQGLPANFAGFRQPTRDDGNIAPPATQTIYGPKKG